MCDKVLAIWLGQIPDIDMNRTQSYEIKLIIVLGISLGRIPDIA